MHNLSEAGKGDRYVMSRWVTGTHQAVAGGAGIWGEGLPVAIGLTMVAAAWGGDSAVTQALTAIPWCPGRQIGQHSPWQWGRPGLGSQCTAPSRHTQTVQVSGSQPAPSGQARPSPRHWGEAGRRHSQDSSCLTLACSSLFWGKGVEGKVGGAGSVPTQPCFPLTTQDLKTKTKKPTRPASPAHTHRPPAVPALLGPSSGPPAFPAVPPGGATAPGGPQQGLRSGLAPAAGSPGCQQAQGAP